MEEILGSEVNETKRISRKLNGLICTRISCVCREKKDEVGQKTRSSHFDSILEKVKCLVRERIGDL